eukprot:SM000240S08617  [mRNA]  locus=s240:83427:85847:+ [translate_table: standard]
MADRWRTRRSEDAERRLLGEGLPRGLALEFEAAGQPRGILVRASILELIARLQAALPGAAGEQPPLQLGEQPSPPLSPPAELTAGVPVGGSGRRAQLLLLDSPAGSGKSVALAVAVAWARAAGWLALYVPSARAWATGGFYYRHPATPALWDTPLQAKLVLQGLVGSHEKELADLPVRIAEPVTLGEGAGLGLARGPQEFAPGSSWSLKDLANRGLQQPQAAVSVLVRLREELASVTEMPVLIAIDEYNSWFTFSGYHESTGARSRRPIHARELRMVDAFRSPQKHPLVNGVMLAAHSHSIAVGRLPAPLPGVYNVAHHNVPRYNPLETSTSVMYYHRSQPSWRPPSTDVLKQLHVLTAGNAAEIRRLSRFL